MKIVTLLSGGLDSSLLACLINEEGLKQLPVFINYGQLNLNKEFDSCKRICNLLHIKEPEQIDLSGFGKSIQSGLTSTSLNINEDAFLPNRNAMLLLTASAYAYKNKCSHIAIGVLDEKKCIFPDQTRYFLNKMEELIEISLGKQIHILSPFIDLNKGEIIALAEKKGINNTYSCHAGTEEPCGKCISCLEFINFKNL
ncbi:MAG: 7-cyano-7-deazaguanine synthase [Bacteroidales bacterium]|nr:7-cyano-7-deazaguanine synthase [Bacteroidales bacterium]